MFLLTVRGEWYWRTFLESVPGGPEERSRAAWRVLLENVLEERSFLEIVPGGSGERSEEPGECSWRILLENSVGECLWRMFLENVLRV